MKKISSLTTLGVLILLTASPFVSISRDWKGYIIMLLGLIVVIISIYLRAELHKVLRALHGEEKESIKDTYVENNPQ